LRVQTRKVKEERIIIAAEQAFFDLGYNARMEDVAKEVGCSKTTLYSYFESKENLYMAITYRAFQAMIDHYYDFLKNSSGNTGLDKVLNFFDSFIAFSEKHYDHQQILLEYLTFIRSISGKDQENKMSEPLRKSIWFQKVRDIHYMPLTIVQPMIKEGQADGSITNTSKPEELFLTIFALLIGYTKLSNSADSERETLFNVDLKTWKNSITELITNILVV